MLVSIGRGRQIGVASKIPLYLLSSIYSSFAKLWCENYGETQWEGKYPLPVSSTKRYFKMQSVHGPSIYHTRYRLHNKPHHEGPLSHQHYVTYSPRHFTASVSLTKRPRLVTRTMRDSFFKRLTSHHVKSFCSLLASSRIGLMVWDNLGRSLTARLPSFSTRIRQTYYSTG
jgi:hypothetical protein